VPQTLVCWSRIFHENYQKKRCIFYLCFSFVRCWITFTWNSFLIPRIQGYVWEEKCKHLAQTPTIWLQLDFVERAQHSFGPIYNLSQVKLAKLHEYINENLKKGFIWQSKFPTDAFILFVKKKMVFYECVSIIVDWINSPSRIDTLCPWSQGHWTNSIMLRCTPSLIYMEHKTWCAFEKAMNGRQHSKSIMAILNIFWCHLVLLMCLLFPNILWTMSFMSTWIILWFVTLKTFSFSQTTWRTKSVVYNYIGYVCN